MTTPGLPLRPTSGSSEDQIEPSEPAGAGLDFGLGEDDLDNQDQAPGWVDRFLALAGRELLAWGWLILALALAFGSAGILAAAQHSPSSGARPELTWAADQVLSSRLDAAVRDLTGLASDVDSLGDMARQTLVSLAQADQSGLQSAWDDGWQDVSSIDSGAAQLNTEFQCGAWGSTMQAGLLKTYSPALVDRYHNVCAAVASVAPLHDDWQAMVDGSQTAIQVVTDIQTHDALAAEALQFATQGLYPEALAKLNGAAASITDATSVAAALARVTDVSTLTQWLSRTTQMDDALQLLWQSMVDSKGKVTAQVTAALRAVNDAKALLPDDNAVLQVVLQEMSSNMTSAGIAIETTRGALANALAGLGSGTVVGR